MKESFKAKVDEFFVLAEKAREDGYWCPDVQELADDFMTGCVQTKEDADGQIQKLKKLIEKIDDKPFSPPKGSFQAELEVLINQHSIENGSNTPDFILACFLRQCLEAFDMATRRRDKFRA